MRVQVRAGLGGARFLQVGRHLNTRRRLMHLSLRARARQQLAARKAGKLVAKCNRV